MSCQASPKSHEEEGSFRESPELPPSAETADEITQSLRTMTRIKRGHKS